MTLSPRKLTLDDIADQRAYEREREEFRAHIIAIKKRRRVSIGPVVTMVFENRDTMRFQIQEMARAERILTDEGVQTELDIYNPVIPEPGQLSSTLFVELTSDDELRDWLPRLVGIERSVVVRFGGQEVRSRPDRDHEAQLTRDEITASVHYIQFDFSEANLAAWETDGPIEVAVDHPEYQFSTTLSVESVSELTSDLLA
jgi:hypothetical protein